MVERILGMDEAVGSNPIPFTRPQGHNVGLVPIVAHVVANDEAWERNPHPTPNAEKV